MLAATTIVGVVLAEIGIRLIHPAGSLTAWSNLIVQRQVADTGDTLLRYDPRVGLAPVPGAHGELAGQAISYSPEGLRNNGHVARGVTGSAILAVGDSYTEGYGVPDAATWPAQLERQRQRVVLNAGVRSYGLDQMVLRAEELVPRLGVETLVLAFIADDVERAGLSLRDSTPKPYFMPTPEGGLELHDVPVPHRPEPSALAGWRRILGYSHLLDAVVRRLGWRDFWYGNWRETGADSDVVACRLMRRLADLAARRSVRTLVVGLHEYETWTDPAARPVLRRRVGAVLECAAAAGLETFDTYEALAAAGAASNPDDFFADWHPNGRANAAIAQAIGARLAGLRD